MHASKQLLAAILAAISFFWGAVAAAGTIQQTIQFPGVAPEAVYNAYMSSKLHRDRKSVV